MGLPEQAFLGEWEALGTSTGPYNLAGWVGGRKGFHERPRANDKEVMGGSLGGPNRADEMRLSAISRHR